MKRCTKNEVMKKNRNKVKADIRCRRLLCAVDKASAIFVLLEIEDEWAIYRDMCNVCGFQSPNVRATLRV